MMREPKGYGTCSPKKCRLGVAETQFRTLKFKVAETPFRALELGVRSMGTIPHHSDTKRIRLRIGHYL